MELIQNYCIRPPSKRVNFQNLVQPSPFNPAALLRDTNFDHYLVLPLTRGVPVQGSLMYMPESGDLSSKQAAPQEWWEMPQSAEIKETPYHSGAWNLQFNTEYAHLSSRQINLSKKQLRTLEAFDD